jgi:hypothetical protein
MPELQRDETDRLLTEWLNRAARAQTHPTGPPFRIEAEKQRIAAEHACELWQFSTKKISAAKGSKFCQLAALLYGDPKADLQYQCRKVLRSAKKVKFSGPK